MQLVFSGIVHYLSQGSFSDCFACRLYWLTSDIWRASFRRSETGVSFTSEELKNRFHRTIIIPRNTTASIPRKNEYVEKLNEIFWSIFLWDAWNMNVVEEKYPIATRVHYAGGDPDFENLGPKYPQVLTRSSGNEQGDSELPSTTDGPGKDRSSHTTGDCMFSREQTKSSPFIYLLTTIVSQFTLIHEATSLSVWSGAGVTGSELTARPNRLSKYFQMTMGLR